jgi:catechol 2,3-dioxygenase
MTYANRKPITVSKVGHVVLKVISLDTALDFYSGVLGLKEVARRDFGEGPMVFLSAGNDHHDLGLVEVGTAARRAALGLHHVALKVGDSLTELAQVKQQLDLHEVAVHMILDHRVSQGIYVSDPDGNLLELHVDSDPSLWRRDATLVAHSDPLQLRT